MEYHGQKSVESEDQTESVQFQLFGYFGAGNGYCEMIEDREEDVAEVADVNVVRGGPPDDDEALTGGAEDQQEFSVFGPIYIYKSDQ